VARSIIMIENYKINKKAVIVVVIFYVTVIILDSIYQAKIESEQNRKNLNLDFSGRVERIDYDIKQLPTIALKGGYYYIGAGYYTDHRIQVGDSMIKRRGTNVYTLIKQGSHKVIKFRKQF
jgi:hypothetical protein